MSSKLPPGSLFLISGVNGFLGSHIAEQLIKHGYPVRGTVRSISSNGWLQEYFEKTYGSGKLELVELPDLSKEGVFDDAVKGCQGFAHVASDLSFSANPNEIITPVLAMTKNALASAAKEPGLKSFVLTSSSTAATNAKPNQKFHIDTQLWNEEAIKDAWRPAPYEDSRKWTVYGASKAQGEQAAWEWVKENKPSFTFNAVLPNANFGRIINSEKQSASTSGWIRAACSGNFDMVKGIPAQYFVNPVDTALLHVAALTDLSIKDERIFAFAAPYHWNDILAICRNYKPDLDIPQDLEDNDRDLTTVDTKLSENLLKEHFGRDGFIGLEESVKQCLDSFA